MKCVQVEVSTRCQLSCLMCPKKVFRSTWISKDMILDDFNKIPFKKFEYVHLQGWGEPLLNPSIDEMIEKARKKCKVGLTTNGLLIDEHIDSILKLDLIAISVASADATWHKKVRGFDLEKLKEKIKIISEQRKKRPKIIVATMMLKSTIGSLPKIVDFALECNADEVIANNLDYVPCEDLDDEKVFDSREFESIIRETKRWAEEVGIPFFSRALTIEEALVCAENPIENCFFTVDGKISPCVYLHLPTSSNFIPRFFMGKLFDVPKVYFKSFDEFMRSKIRETYRKRLQILHQSLPLEFPDLPECCKTCYKAFSV